MPDVTIREATEVDLPRLRELYNMLAFSPYTLTDEEMRAVFAKTRQYPSLHTYVAEAGGRIVGTYALLFLDTLGFGQKRSAIVEDVVVDSACRGQGIGKVMMQDAFDRAREAGCVKIALSSNIRREDAHRFYENLGFKKHGYSYYLELEP